MKILVMETAIKTIISSCAVRGFIVKVVLIDIQFIGIQDLNNLVGVVMNMVSGDKHVEDMEYLIWVYKECICYYWAMIPFKKIPKVMVIHLVKTAAFLLILSR